MHPEQKCLREERVYVAMPTFKPRLDTESNHASSMHADVDRPCVLFSRAEPFCGHRRQAWTSVISALSSHLFAEEVSFNTVYQHFFRFRHLLLLENRPSSRSAFQVAFQPRSVTFACVAYFTLVSFVLCFIGVR